MRIGVISAIRRDAEGTDGDWFDLLGERFDVKQLPSGLDALDWSAAVADKDVPELTRITREVLAACMDEPTLDRYRRLCREQAIGVDGQFRTVDMLLEAAAGRPTVRFTSSLGGPQNTQEPSTDTSSLDAARARKYEARGFVPVASAG